MRLYALAAALAWGLAGAACEDDSKYTIGEPTVSDPSGQAGSGGAPANDDAAAEGGASGQAGIGGTAGAAGAPGASDDGGA